MVCVYHVIYHISSEGAIGATNTHTKLKFNNSQNKANYWLGVCRTYVVSFYTTIYMCVKWKGMQHPKSKGVVISSWDKWES